MIDVVWLVFIKKKRKNKKPKKNKHKKKNKNFFLLIQF